MYDELVKRLREDAEDGYLIQTRIGDDIAEAADAVEAQQKLIDAHLGIIKQYQEYLKKSTWIPVTERLPRTWEEVMLRFPNNQAVGFHDGDSGWAVFSGDNMYTYVAPEEVHPTHWKPKEE